MSEEYYWILNYCFSIVIVAAAYVYAHANDDWGAW